MIRENNSRQDMSTDETAKLIAALRTELTAGTLDAALQKRLARLEDQFAIEKLLEQLQHGYGKAFDLQRELDSQYKACKAAIEAFTAKWGEAPNTSAKLGKLTGFPHVQSES